ncbi:hypothetical protein MIND_00417500 [Mycena indigotica]|uniref:Uncharacterized protein n=1 Tax=Mycena indigotica TaxID=2126181 RepID=A0A8H6SXQ5_9AGAR|nr:uncharacterized protein MIND_00417500 [Mycena indigotica]KAF7306267.1 hypothetical protein MIND_00417500 [Mycena indigotica]
MTNSSIASLDGSSPMVLTFLASAMSLTFAPASSIQVCFALRNTPASTMQAMNVLGFKQAVFGGNTIFSASLTDKNHVYIIPQAPPGNLQQSKLSTSIPGPIGSVGPINVNIDDKSKAFHSLSCRVDVDNVDAKDLFSSKTLPSISQISSCVLKLEIDKHAQNVIFPIPIRGGQIKMKLARKSSYIEIIVPPFRPFQDGGMKSTTMFPVVRTDTGFSFPWNIHRINLTRSPTLPINAPNSKKWLDWHLGSMLSEREYALVLAQRESEDAIASAKRIMSSLIASAYGLHSPGNQRQRVVELCRSTTEDCDLILFVDELKLDLASHTVVGDAYIVPFSLDMLSNSAFAGAFRKLDRFSVPLSEDEARMIKQLLPALVERCRSWQHSAACEYLSPDSQVPLSLEMGKNPLCSCGRGKDVAGMRRTLSWRPFAHSATRLALTPLFALSYIEQFGRPDNLKSLPPQSQSRRESAEKCVVLESDLLLARVSA